MARVTVEDCITKVDNRFELVMLAANRARAISSGAPLTVDRDNDKNPVVALREIADETVAVADARESLIRGLQQRHEFEEFGEDEDVIVAEGGDDDGPIVLEAPETASSEPSAFAETPPSEVIGE